MRREFQHHGIARRLLRAYAANARALGVERVQKLVPVSKAGSRDPTIVVSTGGTVGMSAIGMFGEGHSGWGIYQPTYSLEALVGSIAWKPAVVEGQIEPREILNLTLMFDHDVIDWAPAARFTKRLVELIESGYGLEDGQAQPKISTEPLPQPVEQVHN